MSKVAVGFATLCVVFALGCDVENEGIFKGSGPGWSTNKRDAVNPNLTGTPLAGLDSEAAVDDAMKTATEEIDKYRDEGVKATTSALKEDLGATGDAVTVDDSKVTGGEQLPTGVDKNGNPVPEQVEFAKYFNCPILAPEPSQDDDCNKLVAPTLQKVAVQVQQQVTEIEQDVAAEHPELTPEAKAFVVAWAQEAMKYGSKVAGIYAVQELRAAGKCDTKLAAMKVAKLLGVEQGQSVVVGYYPWAQAQAATCVVNTDVIANQVKVKSLADVDTFMVEHKVCVDVDVSNQNTVLLQAEEKREEGIKEGIANQVEVLRGLLVTWTAACRRTGDPLAIDLDGNGPSFSASPVTFDLLADGRAPRVSWVGPRMGLLAIDLDGDGRIASAAELFSDRSPCPGGRCPDGVAALAAYDSRDRGGNGDGLVDSRDAVYSSLRLWTDTNQDGISQPNELRTLAEAGILALSLDAQQGVEGRSSARLQVLTTNGFRTAYDLWLDMGLTQANLAALKP